MDSVFQSGWEKYGFAFLFAISGWVVAWKLWQERAADKGEYWTLVKQSIEATVTVHATLDMFLKALDNNDFGNYETETTATAEKSAGRRRA